MTGALACAGRDSTVLKNMYFRMGVFVYVSAGALRGQQKKVRISPGADVVGLQICSHVLQEEAVEEQPRRQGSLEK